LSGIVRSGSAISFFKKFVKDTHAEIVDIGCGDGTFLNQLSEAGYRNVWGVDIIRYPSLESLRVKFVDVSSGDLPWRDATQDAITAWEVFEHVENPRLLVREIHRILKPNGFLFVSLPNVFHLMSRLMFLGQGNFPRWKEKNDHYNVFSHHVFNKVFLGRFELTKKSFCCPEIGKGLFNSVTSRLKFLDRYLPENELFGRFVVYILRSR
jgi:SAM-dependent methyltransferase